jgi:predicted nucleic acid-binding protein
VILVDTSAFHAILDRDDVHHSAADATMRMLRDADASLLTHEYVVIESVALIQRRLGLTALRRFVDHLLPLAQVLWVDESLHLEAREALLAAEKQDVSLVDWTSFLVMRRHGVHQAFAFDPGFAAQGFEVIPGAGPTR